MKPNFRDFLARLVFATALVLCACFAHAQTFAPYSGTGSAQFFDNNGQVLNGGVLYSFQAGTSTQQATYTDSTGTTLNPNPIPFGSGARVSIWMNTSLVYKFVLCLQNDGVACAPADVLFSVDQVPGNLNGTAAGTSPFTGTFISGSASPATTGILRLASADTICWRNTAGTINLCLAKDTNDVLSWGGGVMKFAEGTCSATATGFDYLCADSSTHHFKYSLNNAEPIVAPGTSSTAATQNHLVSYAANGYDIQDTGAGQPNSTAVTFSATPTFTVVGQQQLFTMTLTGNVTSSTLGTAGIVAPTKITIELTQDATGGRTFVWPANVINPYPVNVAPNAVTSETFTWDGTNAYLSTPPPCATVAKSAAYTLTSGDCVVGATVAAGSFTITIPHLTTGVAWEITRTDSTANTLTIAGDSGNVNGATNIHLPPNATTVCHADGVNSWCTLPGAEYPQSGVVSGCGATCTFTYPVPYTTLKSCLCSGEGGSCNIASKSTTACTINTTVGTNDVMVSGIP